MTVTANVDKSKRPPQVEKADVAVKQGKEQLQVLDWVPRENAPASSCFS
jgi:hypothetical protein